MDATPDKRAVRLRALLVFLVLAGFVALALAGARAPSPAPATAPASEFSAERAMRHVEAIAQSPRRTGSAASDEARRYILAELAALGWDASVQEATVVQARYMVPARGARVATVKNIVARRPGANPKHDAVLLMAHYDTRSMTPGASDDGAGTACLLETARALTTARDGALRNDVILLFTDAEEEGLLGAKAFVAEHPSVKDVRLVMNFEARGSSGPALMFQTSDGNKDLIGDLARGTSRPMANAISRAIYKQMPNDTDFTEWLPLGIDGLNFANIEGFDRYHAATDDPGHLDRGTLQHHGSYALSLARYFGDRELAAAHTDKDAAYFNVGPLFVHYPLAWTTAVTALALAAYGAFVVLALRKKELTLRGTSLGAGLALLGPVVAVFASEGLWKVVSGAHPEYALLDAASAPMKLAYCGAFVALTLAVVLGVHALAFHRTKLAELATGAGALWSACAVIASLYLPEAAYLFAWPLLASSIVWATLVVRGRIDGGHPAVIALHLASAALPVLLFAPTAAQLFVAFGPAAGGPIAAVVAVLAVLLVPALRMLLAADRRVVPAIAGVVALGLVIAGHVSATFNANNPRPDTLFYAVDADTKRAYWVTPDAAPDAWTERVLGASSSRSLAAFFPTGTEGPLLASEAPTVESLASTEPPTVTVVADERTAAGRTLTLRLATPRAVEVLAAFLPAKALVRARVQGKEVPLLKNGGLGFYYTGPPPSGIEVVLELSSSDASALRLVTQQAGFPRDAIGPRPPGLMPRSGTLSPWDELTESDMTLVSKLFPL